MEDPREKALPVLVPWARRKEIQIEVNWHIYTPPETWLFHPRIAGKEEGGRWRIVANAIDGHLLELVGPGSWRRQEALLPTAFSGAGGAQPPPEDPWKEARFVADRVLPAPAWIAGGRVTAYLQVPLRKDIASMVDGFNGEAGKPWRGALLLERPGGTSDLSAELGLGPVHGVDLDGLDGQGVLAALHERGGQPVMSVFAAGEGGRFQLVGAFVLPAPGQRVSVRASPGGAIYVAVSYQMPNKRDESRVQVRALPAG